MQIVIENVGKNHQKRCKKEAISGPKINWVKLYISLSTTKTTNLFLYYTHNSLLVTASQMSDGRNRYYTVLYVKHFAFWNVKIFCLKFPNS